MSLITNLGKSLLNISPYRFITGEGLASKYFHLLTTETASTCKPDSIYTVATRSKIRWHFPKPNERKRIKRHGWWTRMATPAGRRVLMNRILKGKHVYSH